MNRNLVELDNEYKEEEIDIYHLIDIFVRNIKTFVIIFIIGLIATALFVGKKVLLDKKNVLSIQYTLNYDELESYLNGKVFYPKKSPTDILLDDAYLEKLFENKDFTFFVSIEKIGIEIKTVMMKGIKAGTYNSL